MAYNTTKDITNKARRRKEERQAKRAKREEKQNRIKDLVSKNSKDFKDGSNLEGYAQDRSGAIKKLW